MTNTLEHRYLVLKYTDIVAAGLSVDALVALADLTERVAASREARGKQPLKVVIVESDWTNYDRVVEEVLAHDRPEAGG